MLPVTKGDRWGVGGHKCFSNISCNHFYYLRQGDYNFGGIYLYVFLSVSNITKKVMNGLR